MIDIDQGNLEKSIQNVPEKIQDTAKTAKDIATKTSTTLQETVNEQLGSVQKNVNQIPVDTISDIPKKIQEQNPLNKKPIIDKNELEKKIHLLTNQYRVQNGLVALSLDDDLSGIARNHSQDMAARNYFSHDSPEGIDPTGRGTSHGYKCEKRIGNVIYSGIAENIFQNNLYDQYWITNGVITSYDWNTLEDIAQSTVDGWMNSAGHRQNILTETYDAEGIGVEISSNDKVYITQDFC